MKEVFRKVYGTTFHSYNGRTKIAVLRDSEWDGYTDFKYHQDQLLMSKDFWIGLGKAMGWVHVRCTKCNVDVRPWGECECDEEEVMPKLQEAWLYHWHRFIDHLAEGKDTESFFEQLLK
jgi:hypothetical protein